MSLTRRFSLLSFATIMATSGITALLLSRFLVERMLLRDAEVAMQFVQLAAGSAAADNFELPRAGEATSELERFFERITTMPDVLRANVYAPDRAVLWSSNRAAIGRHFEANPELDRALAGKLAVDAALLDRHVYWKPEHLLGAALPDRFVENYIPVWDAARVRVVGVIELYKEPQALIQTIHDGVKLIWFAAIVGGTLLYLVLIWLVRSGDRLIRRQHERIVSGATLAAVGELSAAVAHSMRNSLAAIRSSAELLPESEQTRDITAEVDRVESWIRALLVYTQSGEQRIGTVDLNALARSEIDGFARELDRHDIRLKLDLDATLPAVASDAALLTQVLRTLIANALDATGRNGRLALSTRPERNAIELRIEDDGCGMTPEELRRVFVPFRTTKKHGLGVGMPLVRRTLESLGGRIDVASTSGVGTTVTVRLPLGSTS